MRRTTMVMSVAAVVFGAATAFAQVTSFAGHWMLQVDPNAAAAAGGAGGGRGGRGGGGGRGGFGMEFTAVQDAKTLTIAQAAAGNGAVPTPKVYNLDGTDSHNMVAMGGGGRGGAGGTPPAPIDQLSKTKWDAKKLVITTTTTTPNGAMESTMSLSIDGGGNLILESSRPGQNGGAATITTQTYKKQ